MQLLDLRFIYSQEHGKGSCRSLFLRSVAAFWVTIALSGCETAAYYTQAINGQWRILEAREPIDDLLDSQDLSPELRDKLALVQSVRTFARDELALPVGGAYDSYADIGRDYVVWNVFAAPEFSVQPKTWCFPIAGCVGYRGYFIQDEAVAKAKALKSEGFDIRVGGTRAYSTLGWFDDPVLNTFIYDNDIKLVSLLIHEIAHRQLYVKGDTGFNESFASAVEQEGTRLWLLKRGVSEQEATVQIDGFRAYRKKRAVINDLVLAYRDKLIVLYESPLDEEAKREQKAALMSALNAAYLVMKQDQGWDDSYDAWMGSMNNAKIASVSQYRSQVPAFVRLLEQHNGNFPAFYRAAEEIASQSPEVRLKAIQALQQADHNRQSPLLSGE
ncbi:Uncharacterised protein [BD1-7 clade bacterium]|uniref:Aminopeptidase n=1 Tax=BD1-7 clade bacterium TaxID=2029982 RepID=A0A5S9NKW1_9GAMM|nr:Uncharacterised protein [BD1-7 clade bacterium]CAA0094162.1 Uncharacterised protein [BD1-7 clade bacterium]